VETPLGYPVLQMIRGRFWANNHTHILEGADVSTRFLRLAVERVAIRPYVTGAAQPKITQANLKRIPVLVANNRLHESFDNVIDPIFDEVHTINHVTG
jgi:type I restriction enzyme, S subunit